MEAGARELRRAKEQVRHGQWIPWVEGEVGLTPRTVQRLMALHEAYPEMRHVSHLSSVNHALRALPSGPKSQSPPEQDASAESETVAAGDTASEVDVATSVRHLARAVERLEPIVERTRGVSARRRASQLPVLCRTLQALVSLLIEYAHQTASDTAGGIQAPKDLIASLDGVLAKVREFSDSIVDQGARRN